MSNNDIVINDRDAGKSFNWGKTSKDYAKYRDIYPEDFYTCDAKDVALEEASLDVITACQCIWYLNYGMIAHKFSKMLKADGSFLILYMGWLPFEDEIAGKREKLILKYNPQWAGCGDTVHPVWVQKSF